ncbi:MAG: HTH domain-containing protein [Planctomycetes bacterium]|nr:HTH domain-containing protein [Planctomycetota bacterium]
MFRTEEQLVESFITQTAPCVWTRREYAPNVRTTFEATCSEGRADWVWATSAQSWNPKMKESVAELMQNPTSSLLLSLLKTEAVRTEQYLLDRTGVSRTTIRRTITDLIEWGLVEAPSDGRFVLGKSFEIPDLEICTFEFKLDDWRRAFYQATRYRSFSHRVYVVMPSLTVHRAFEYLSSFRQQNIGLLSHSPDKGSTRILASRKRRPRSRSGFIKAVGMLQQQGN